MSKTESRRPVMTTTSGVPIADNQNALTAGPQGPLLVQDWQLIEKLAHQNASGSRSASCTPKAGARTAR